MYVQPECVKSSKWHVVLNNHKNHHMSNYQHLMPTHFKAYSWHYFSIAWELDID